MKPFKSNLFINDRTDIALAVGADGVHLTTRSLKPAVVRKIVSANDELNIYRVTDSKS